MREQSERKNDKLYGACQFRDEDGYCCFDKSSTEIENEELNLCDNIRANETVCKIS